MRKAPRIGLTGLITYFALAACVLPWLAALPVLGDMSRTVTRRQATGVMQVTLEAKAAALGARLSEQWREVRRLARYAEEDPDPAHLRIRLDTVIQINPLYAWIGSAEIGGKVLVSTDGILEGTQVDGRPWFKNGAQEPFAGDVHDAVLLKPFVDAGSKEPLRLIDFAVPLRRADGVPTGVLGAHVRWSTVREMLVGGERPDGIEVMLLARDGTVLVGPAGLEGQKLSSHASPAAEPGVIRSRIETWPDGSDYLTSTLPGIGIKDAPGFGWSLIARQPASIALADTYSTASQLLMIASVGGIAAIAASFGFGCWVARPLRRLAAASEEMVSGRLTAPIPESRAYAEVASLSDSLARLDLAVPATGTSGIRKA